MFHLLFFIDCDAWKGLVDSKWGCNVDVAAVILLVSTIVESHEICNVPIRHQSLLRSSCLRNNKYSHTSSVVINSSSIMNNWKAT